MIIRSLLAGLTGLVIGIGSALFLIFGPADFGGVSVGPWRTNTLIGSPDAPGLVRAVVARRGLLALSREQAMYFSADQDSEGRPLQEACTYRLAFPGLPDAFWWSVTLYAEDDFLAVNGLEAHSVTADDFGLAPIGFAATVSPNRAEGAWISTQNAGAFNLTLRLYKPIEEIVEDPGRAILPSIERLDCGASS